MKKETLKGFAAIGLVMVLILIVGVLTGSQTISAALGNTIGTATGAQTTYVVCQTSLINKMTEDPKIVSNACIRTTDSCSKVFSSQSIGIFANDVNLKFKFADTTFIQAATVKEAGILDNTATTFTTRICTASNNGILELWMNHKVFSDDLLQSQQFTVTGN